MANETYANANMISVEVQRTRAGRLRLDTHPAEVPHPTASEIQRDLEKRTTEPRCVMWIYPLVAVGFMVMCILQVSLNVFLRLHYMSSTEVDKLKAEINNVTSMKSAEIQQLKAELNNLTSVKSAEIEQLKAELNNFSSMTSAKIEQLKADSSNCIKERDQLQKQQQELETRLCRMEDSCEGWVGFETSTYYVSTEEKPWPESRQDCKDRGADLAIVNSEEEQRFLHSLRESAWIGLSDNEGDMTFHWVDGTTAFPSFWGIDQPTYAPDELCVMIYRYYTYQNSWFDTYCDVQHQWICEKQRFNIE